MLKTSMLQTLALILMFVLLTVLLSGCSDPPVSNEAIIWTIVTV